MATQQLEVTLTRASGATEDVTSSASYESSDSEIASVSSDGLITAEGAGSATVTVTHSGLSGTCEVTVEDPAEGLDVEPSTASLTLE